MRHARIAFALLVLVTGGAFFVTQRLKQSPRLVRTLTVTREFSPAIAFRRASIRIRLERTDDATVAVIDTGGDVVRRLLRSRRLASDRRVQLLWDGRDEEGRIVPDGEYRVRINLRRRGRAVVLLNTIRVDATPPHPVVRVRKPKETAGPLLHPQRPSAPVRFAVTGTRPQTERLFLYRTDGPRPRFVTRLPARRPGADGVWDGRAGGRLVAPGPYAVVARDTDRAGNAASSYPFTRSRENDPPGGAGVTVRYLATQPPQGPVTAGRLFTVFVDARGRAYRWRLRRLGQRRLIARGTGRQPALRLTAPRGPSGIYLVELIAGAQRAAAPVAVQGPGRHRVLVVLPLLSWQGHNRVDDDGDGMPDSLEPPGRGRARLARPLAGGGMPGGFALHEQPLLELLDRPQQRYDITTDVALAGPGGRREVERHRGIVLAGNPRWVTPQLASRLRVHVTRGGRVLSLGTDSLRRTVALREGVLSRPSPPDQSDVFGVTLAPIERRRVDLLNADDAIGLFRGGDGFFNEFGGFEATLAFGDGRPVAAAVVQGSATADPVIVAIRLGSGLVIRTGLPEWGRRMRGNPNVQALTRRSWELLSR